jgi:chromosome transmission fidelity protein 1
MQTVVVTKGPRGKDFEFKFDSRRDPETVRRLQGLFPRLILVQIAELGQALSNIINLTPAGMVVFFPSYAFLDVVKTAWQANGLLARWASKKKVMLCAILSITVLKH